MALSRRGSSKYNKLLTCFRPCGTKYVNQKPFVNRSEVDKSSYEGMCSTSAASGAYSVRNVGRRSETLSASCKPDTVKTAKSVKFILEAWGTRLDGLSAMSMAMVMYGKTLNLQDVSTACLLADMVTDKSYTLEYDGEDLLYLYISDMNIRHKSPVSVSTTEDLYREFPKMYSMTNKDLCKYSR